jgi:hypothetical protein
MKSLEQRFFAKVDKGGESGCWEWTAGKGKGYGRFQIGDKACEAHRVSYELHHGPIATGFFVCHSCDNRGCVNPDHLFLGTNAENTADKVAKGRQARGHSIWRRRTVRGGAKLSEADIIAIRASTETQRACAKRFGISNQQISRIKAGKRWAHL